PMAGLPVQWRSSDVAVAEVTEDGVVAVLDHGLVSITAASGDLTDTVRLRTVEISPRDTTLVVGDTLEYRMWSTDAAGMLRSVTDFHAMPDAGGESFLSPIRSGDDLTARVVATAAGSATVLIVSGAPWGRFE